MRNDHGADFAIRGLETHSTAVWDYDWIMELMDTITTLDMNTLVLHRNDFIDELTWPGKYFGYQKKPGDRSYFDIYNQTYLTLYKYTPVRRPIPFQKGGYLKRILEQARRRNIQVYIENKELYFPDIILELHPELVHDGHICANDPFWPEFLKEKYREFFSEYPEVAGIITSPATGESKVSIMSNRCQCPRCQRTTKGEWFRSILTAMYEVTHEMGKKLVVRDFVFDPAAQQQIASVMESLPEDVVISLKNTPHDYYPTFPENPRIGNVGDHEQWLEFDTMGQYFGWGLGVSDMMEDYRARLRSAKQKGASGAIFRLDWEGLDSHSSFQTPNKINVYSGAMLSKDTQTPPEDIYSTFLRREGWLSGKGDEAEAEAWIRSILGRTWPITAKTVFINGCVFSDSSLIPVSMEHALWLSEEKNSLKDWDSSKADSLLPKRQSVEACIQEKQWALAQLDQLCQDSREWPDSISDDKADHLSQWFGLDREYLLMFRDVAEATMIARYLLYTEEQDESYRQEKKAQLQTVLEDLRQMEERFRQLFRQTDHTPWTVYTLLDPEHVNCFRRNIQQLPL